MGIRIMNAEKFKLTDNEVKTEIAKYDIPESMVTDEVIEAVINIIAIVRDAQVAKILSMLELETLGDVEMEDIVPAFRKEVVEWIKQHSLIDTTDPTLYHSFRMSWQDWQSKLKEWGISPV